MRGGHSLEKKNGGSYRNRSTRLGDIVNSAPVFVGAPGFRYPGSLEAAAYANFKASHKNRRKMIYVGANDGMLHGFNAETGVEEMAYVPARLFGKLSTLASTGYTHKYFVDGSPTVIDAYVGNRWRSMLVGGYNKGGQGIYALDVTDPSTFSESPGDAKSCAGSSPTRTMPIWATPTVVRPSSSCTTAPGRPSSATATTTPRQTERSVPRAMRHFTWSISGPGN